MFDYYGLEMPLFVGNRLDLYARAIPDDSIFVTKIATRLTSDIAVFPPLVSSIYSGLLARLDRSSFRHAALFSLNVIPLSLNTELIFVLLDIASFRALIRP